MSSEQKEIKNDLPRSTSRSTARLYAVQALYQMDLAQTDLNDVIQEFASHRLEEDADGGAPPVDKDFFRDVLMGVVKNQREIDPIVNAKLASGWNLSRIDSILRAILRSSAYELIHRKDIPAKVVISEYIDIAHAFFEGTESKVVNGVLDHVAKTVRSDEF